MCPHVIKQFYVCNKNPVIYSVWPRQAEPASVILLDFENGGFPECVALFHASYSNLMLRLASTHLISFVLKNPARYKLNTNVKRLRRSSSFAEVKANLFESFYRCIFSNFYSN